MLDAHEANASTTNKKIYTGAITRWLKVEIRLRSNKRIRYKINQDPGIKQEINVLSNNMKEELAEHRKKKLEQLPIRIRHQ